jgi:hypothetical protein
MVARTTAASQHLAAGSEPATAPAATAMEEGVVEPRKHLKRENVNTNNMPFIFTTIFVNGKICKRMLQLSDETASCSAVLCFGR